MCNIFLFFLISIESNFLILQCILIPLNLKNIKYMNIPLVNSLVFCLFIHPPFNIADIKSDLDISRENSLDTISSLLSVKNNNNQDMSWL